VNTDHVGQRPRRWLIGVAAVAAPLLLLTACGDDGPSEASTPSTDQTDTTTGGSDEWAAIVEAAEEEGRVTLYTTHLEPQQVALREVFEAAYPDIELEISRIVTPAEMASALDSERTSGAAGGDVAIMTDTATPARYAEEEQLLAPSGPNREAWADLDAFVDGKYFVANYTVNGIAWNTDQVDEPLASYEDLLRPELAGGLIAIVDAATAPVLTDYWAFVEDNAPDGFLEDLAAQEPVVYPSVAPIAQALIAGEVAVAMYSTPDILAEQANGAPVDFAVTDPTWGPPFVTFAPAWSKHPNAALVLMDVLMSEEGQAAIASNGSPARPGVEGFTTVDRVTPVNPDRATPQHSESYLPRWNELFGR
jgi:iron(III) transport system substrate-binding protein